jgi:hypothetical protein
MDANEFHQKHGRKIVDQVREKLGMSLCSWYHIKNYARPVTPDRAVKLAIASDEITAGDGMQIVDLLRLRDLPARVVGTGKDEA